MFSKSNKKNKIKFSFPLPLKRKESVHGDILIKGKLLVFIVCSIVSSLVNLVFISNLTKTDYKIGTLISIPAAVFLGSLSIALDLSKALHVVQVNTLNELYRKLADKPWAKVIKSQARKWNSIYILYVVLSIITSVSLSSISIGAGIKSNSDGATNCAEQLKKVTEFTASKNNVDSTILSNLISQAVDTSEADAIQYAKERINTIRPLIEKYKEDRAYFEETLGFDVSGTEEVEFNGEKIIPSKYWDQRNNEINIQLQNAGYGKVSGQQIKNLNIVNVQSVIKNNYLSLSKTSIDLNNSKLNKFTDSMMNESARPWVMSLNSLGLKDPTTGSPVVFDTDESKSTIELINLAKAKLSYLYSAYTNDSGDIGSSSKIFIQLGSAIDSAKSNKNSADLTKVQNSKTSSFGTTELLMMGMLLFLSLLCELAINQFSPKASITRKMLSQFSQYFPKDFNVNEFMMQVAYDARDYDEISDKELESQIKYCQSRIDIKNKVSAKPEKVHVEKDIDNKKIEQLISDIGGELND